MNTHELAQRLEAEGCAPHSYAIGQRGTASDAFCLMCIDGQWQVFYTERGFDQPPFFTSASESDACAFFLDYMLHFIHQHLVGFFRSELAAHALREQLQELGLSTSSDSILYRAPAERRYRVFVAGRAIFRARAALGELPLQDA